LIGFFHLENTTNHHCSTIFNQYLRFDMLGINSYALRRSFTTAILIDIQIKNNIPFRRDLRCDLKFENGLLESQCRGTIRGGYRIRVLGTLFNQGLGLVGSDNSRAGYNFALAICFHGREFKRQESIGGRVEYGKCKTPTLLTLDRLAGKLTKFPFVLVVPPAPLEATASL
jgi:hypothetical protein